MDCLRHETKNAACRSSSGTVNYKHLSDVFPMNDCKAEKFRGRVRSRQWNKMDKTTYAKLLLSYLMNNLDTNDYFIQHLAHLLNKTCKEVKIFHRKMVSEFASTASIITHVLRHTGQKRSHWTLHSLPTVPLPDLFVNTQNTAKQELQADEKAQQYLHNLVFADESLEQFQEHLSDSGEIADLNDDCVFREEERTNDSFDSTGNEQVCEYAANDYLNR